MKPDVITVDEVIGDIFKDYPQVVEPFKRSLIAFAKLHVQAALKAASEKAQISGKWGDDKSWISDVINTTDQDGEWMLLRPDKNSILNAYPLDNIK